jgi:hypothetical protein
MHVAIDGKIVTNAVTVTVLRYRSDVTHHLLKQVLLVQEHKDWRVSKDRVLDNVLKQLQALVHPVHCCVFKQHLVVPAAGSDSDRVNNINNSTAQQSCEYTYIR